MRSSRIAFIAALIALPLAAATGSARGISEYGIGVPMRDGVRLSTNVFRPAEAGRHPAILLRTPYDKGDAITPACQSFVDHGYAVVVQDVRGRYLSGGHSSRSIRKSTMATTR